MRKRQQVSLLIFIVVVVVSIIIFDFVSDSSTFSSLQYYTYKVVNSYPHDSNAFTQGLVFDNGVLYESTGLYLDSTLRSVDLETGYFLYLFDLPSQFFGEGVTIYDNKIIQLTWRSGIGFVYDKESFDLLREFSYSTEGWGITHNSSHLIMSDGTSILHFLDPETFEAIGEVEVYDDSGLVSGLNELEYIRGEIFANVWKEDMIARIDPRTGQVTGWIDLSGIGEINRSSNNMLNGIAYDFNGDRIFVTGKRWSKIYEIKLVASE